MDLTIIPSQRLVTMSVSLHTQTVLHCLIIQVLNIKSLFPKCLIHFTCLFHVCWELGMLWTFGRFLVLVSVDHGLVILTESFSPLRSVLHNLCC